MNPAILLFLAMFAVLAVCGAFMGASRAQVFFNSALMMIFWCVLTLFLAAGFFAYPLLRKRPALMLIHLGCLGVLVGGMLNSAGAHRLIARWLDRPAWAKGQMLLGPGQSSAEVVLETEGAVGKLPFNVRLEETFVEYYDKPAIGLYFNDGARWAIAAEAGKEIQIPDGRGTVQVGAVYKNFKMKRDNGRMVSYESAEPGINPAYQLIFTPAGGTAETIYVFERLGRMHDIAGRTCRAEYMAPRMIKDYKSTLQIVRDGKVLKQTTIEVNKPLFYGGYHFYQHTFAEDQSGPVSGIMVVSARGIWLVFSGYALVFAGLVMQLGTKLFIKRTNPGDVKGQADGN